MSAAQTKVSNSVTGEFNSPELASGFIGPLKSVDGSNVKHVVVHFDKESNSVKINAMNENRTVIIFVEYLNGLVDSLKINQDYNLGIYDLTEFVSMYEIFSGGANLEINNNVVTIENEGQQFYFLGSDPDAIKTGPKTLKADLKWLAEFTWSKADFGPFFSALSKLNEEYVILQGKEGEKTFSLKIANHEMRSSAFTFTVDLEEANFESFNIVLNKEYFKNIVNSHSNESLNIQISEKLVSFSVKNEYSKIRYYVNAVAKAN